MTSCRTANPKVALLLLGVLVFVPGAGSEDEVQLAKNRLRLQNMPVHERVRLREEYKRFSALPASRQEELRELHQKLQVLSEPDRLALQQEMARYLSWLDTLPPTDQQLLDAIENPTEKIAKVRELMAAQKAKLQQDLARLPAPDPERTPHRFMKSIQEKINRIERLVLPKLTEAEQQQYKALDESAAFRKPTILVLYAKKYDVEIRTGVREDDWIWDIQDRHLYTFISESRLFGRFVPKWNDPDAPPKINNRLGVDDEKLDEVRDLLLELLLLPGVPNEEIYKIYESLEQKERFDIRENDLKYTAWMMLLRMKYYRQHPEKLSDGLKQLLRTNGPSTGRREDKEPPGDSPKAEEKQGEQKQGKDPRDIRRRDGRPRPS